MKINADVNASVLIGNCALPRSIEIRLRLAQVVGLLLGRASISGSGFGDDLLKILVAGVGELA